MTSRGRQAAPGSCRPSPVAAGEGGRSLASTRETATWQNGGGKNGAPWQHGGSLPGLQVGLPVGGRCSGSRKPALFTEAGGSDLDRPVRRNVARRCAGPGGDGASEVPALVPRAGWKISGARGGQAGRSGWSVVKRETHRRAGAHASKRAGCHTSRGSSSLKCGLQKSVRSISGCLPFGRKIGRQSL